MLGLSFAAVPLYDIFCRVTGFGGTTQISKDTIEKIEDIVHRTPISERSKIPIEIIPMEEYYLKQKDAVEKIKKLGLIFIP